MGTTVIRLNARPMKLLMSHINANTPTSKCMSNKNFKAKEVAAIVRAAMDNEGVAVGEYVAEVKKEVKQKKKDKAVLNPNCDGLGAKTDGVLEELTKKIEESKETIEQTQLRNRKREFEQGLSAIIAMDDDACETLLEHLEVLLRNLYCLTT